MINRRSHLMMQSLDRANEIRAVYSLIDTVFDSIDYGDKNHTATLLSLLDEKLGPAIDSLVELLKDAVEAE